MNTQPIKTQSESPKKKPRPGYKTLEFNVSTFVPSLYTFYNYQQILKKHNFIRDVQVIHRNNELMIRVERIHPKSP